MVPPELRQPVLVPVIDPQAVDDDLALVGLVQPGEDVQQRRLPTAGRTHQGDELAVGDVQVDAAQRAYRRQLGLERPADATCLQCGHHLKCPSPVRGRAEWESPDSQALRIPAGVPAGVAQ